MQGLRGRRGSREERTQGEGAQGALSHYRIAAPRCRDSASPLRKFLQTKIYTDTTVSTAVSAPSSLLPVPSSSLHPLPLFLSFSLSFSGRLQNRDKYAGRGTFAAHFIIPRFHKNMTVLARVSLGVTFVTSRLTRDENRQRLR